MTKPFIPHDHFSRQARRAGFLARSAFKLKAINDRFHILKPGQTILDLGASPGSWLQVASRIAGADGLVVGVDRETIRFRSPNVKTFKSDIFDQRLSGTLAPFGPFNAILSDLAPKTSGIRDRDQALSLQLAEQALTLAAQLLKRNGSLILKIFQGPTTTPFIKKIKTMFKAVHTFKPAASRERSFEIYVIALDKIDPVGSR